MCKLTVDMLFPHINIDNTLNRLNFLDRRVASGMPSSRSEDWQPLVLYRNSLVHGETDQVPVTSKRAYTRKRKEHLNEDDEEDNDDSDADPDFRA